MKCEMVAQMRSRAAQLRRVSEQIREQGAQKVLRMIADAVDSEADELENSSADSPG